MLSIASLERKLCRMGLPSFSTVILRFRRMGCTSLVLKSTGSLLYCSRNCRVVDAGGRLSDFTRLSGGRISLAFACSSACMTFPVSAFSRARWDWKSRHFRASANVNSMSLQKSKRTRLKPIPTRLKPTWRIDVWARWDLSARVLARRRNGSTRMRKLCLLEK